MTDAWKEYHSVPLRESDCYLTTFVTPFGHWFYKRAPQGFLSSGNGCNGQPDTILSDFGRKEHIVDDTISTTMTWRSLGGEPLIFLLLLVGLAYC